MKLPPFDLKQFEVNQIPDILILINKADFFDQINEQTYPDLVIRVALKEKLIAEMAATALRLKIPLTTFSTAANNGLKTTFLRGAGEHGRTDQLGSIETIALASGPQDWNLKWQVVRAYVTMFQRLNDPAIIASAISVIDTLLINADEPLLKGIAHMKDVLGIN